MKKIVFFALMFVAGTYSFAQSQSAKVNSLEMYNNQKFKDVFTFELTEKITKDEVAKASSFYTKYFTTSFDEKKNSITVTMANQEKMNRQIMRRLFAALNIQEIAVEGQAVQVDEFFKTYVFTPDQQPTK